MKTKLLNPDEPLSLPRGSVRAIIALLVIVGTFIFFIVHEELPEILEWLVIVVITYYYASRGSAKKEEPTLPDAV